MRPNRPALFYILNMILTVESMITSGPVYPGTNLRGQMFTLSRYGGGVSLYPPSLNPSSPSPSWTPYTTSYWQWKTTTSPPWKTTTPGTTSPPWETTAPGTTSPPWKTTTSPPWKTTAPGTTSPPWKTTTPGTTSPPTTTPVPTTAFPRGGVSVCVRYMAEDGCQIFTLSHGYSRMVLSEDTYGFTLTLGYNSKLTFSSNRQLWPSVRAGLWTSVCVTVDSRKGVAQVFRGGTMSIRRRLPTQYEWTGPPVIDISNIDGQLTDVQVWSSSLSNNDVFLYMTCAEYGEYRGSVLTWFDISYSLRGNSLLEKAYETQGSISQRTDQPIRGHARESAGLIEKRRKKVFRKQGRKDRKREWSSLVFVL